MSETSMAHGRLASAKDESRGCHCLTAAIGRSIDLIFRFARDIPMILFPTNLTKVAIIETKRDSPSSPDLKFQNPSDIIAIC